MFQNISKIKESGFTGFKTVEQLWNDTSFLPNERGVYLILTIDSSQKTFMTKGVGGFFKEKDPNIGLAELNSNWVSGSNALYIGQAGGGTSSATLKKRLKQYLDFGKGKPVGHYGGRLIWQLSNHKDLIVAWKITRTSDPREEESKLINEFVNYFGKLPFANLKY